MYLGLAFQVQFIIRASRTKFSSVQFKVRPQAQRNATGGRRREPPGDGEGLGVYGLGSLLVYYPIRPFCGHLCL